MARAAAGDDNQRGLARIRAFLDDYHVDDGRRRPIPAERSLIEAALVDYLLAEEWLVGPVATRLATGLRAVDRLRRLELPPHAQTMITVIGRVIHNLNTRVVRREEANLIMREHLVMLSETIRQMRLGQENVSIDVLHPHRNSNP